MPTSATSSCCSTLCRGLGSKQDLLDHGSSDPLLAVASLDEEVLRRKPHSAPSGGAGPAGTGQAWWSRVRKCVVMGHELDATLVQSS